MSSRRDCLSLSETNSVARIFTRSSTSIARARKFSTGGGPHGYGRGRLVVIQAQRGRNFSRVPPRLPQQAAAPNTAEFPSRHENRNRFAWPRVLAAEGTEVVRGGSGVRRSSRGRGVELGGRELAALPPHQQVSRRWRVRDLPRRRRSVGGIPLGQCRPQRGDRRRG